MIAIRQCFIFFAIVLTASSSAASPLPLLVATEIQLPLLTAHEINIVPPISSFVYDAATPKGSGQRNSDTESGSESQAEKSEDFVVFGLIGGIDANITRIGGVGGMWWEQPSFYARLEVGGLQGISTLVAGQEEATCVGVEVDVGGVDGRWLSYDSFTRTFAGIPPLSLVGARPLELPASLSYQDGTIYRFYMHIRILPSTFSLTSLPNSTTIPGDTFDYSVSPYVKEDSRSSEFSYSVVPASSRSWLNFDRNNLRLTGKPPMDRPYELLQLAFHHWDRVTNTVSTSFMDSHLPLLRATPSSSPSVTLSTQQTSGPSSFTLPTSSSQYEAPSPTSATLFPPSTTTASISKERGIGFAMGVGLVGSLWILYEFLRSKILKRTTSKVAEVGIEVGGEKPGVEGIDEVGEKEGGLFMLDDGEENAKVAPEANASAISSKWDQPDRSHPLAQSAILNSTPAGSQSFNSKDFTTGFPIKNRGQGLTPVHSTSALIGTRTHDIANQSGRSELPGYHPRIVMTSSWSSGSSSPPVNVIQAYPASESGTSVAVSSEVSRFDEISYQNADQVSRHYRDEATINPSVSFDNSHGEEGLGSETVQFAVEDEQPSPPAPTNNTSSPVLACAGRVFENVIVTAPWTEQDSYGADEGESLA